MAVRTCIRGPGRAKNPLRGPKSQSWRAKLNLGNSQENICTCWVISKMLVTECLLYGHRLFYQGAHTEETHSPASASPHWFSAKCLKIMPRTQRGLTLFKAHRASQLQLNVWADLNTEDESMTWPVLLPNIRCSAAQRHSEQWFSYLSPTCHQISIHVCEIHFFAQTEMHSFLVLSSRWS